MTTRDWYHETEDELRALCVGVNFRICLEQRLVECKSVNYHGVRCHMSVKQAEKLERVLA